MFYENLETGEFGIPLADAKAKCPQMSIPENATEFGPFRAYAFSDRPEYDRLTHGLREVRPVNHVQRWEVYELSEAERSSIAAQALAAAKAARQLEVDAITVTTAAGNTFDGDERSQDRMGTTLAAMDEGDTGPWVLADNTVITITRAELREALRLARSAMAAIWIKPYA